MSFIRLITLFLELVVSISVDRLAGRSPAPQITQRLGQDILGLTLRATLLDIGQVRLIGQNVRRRRRVAGIGVGRQTATRTIPGLGIVGADGESLSGLMPVGAII
jgi:hypothetical protein